MKFVTLLVLAALASAEDVKKEDEAKKEEENKDWRTKDNDVKIGEGQCATVGEIKGFFTTGQEDARGYCHTQCKINKKDGEREVTFGGYFFAASTDWCECCEDTKITKPEYPKYITYKYARDPKKGEWLDDSVNYFGATSMT